MSINELLTDFETLKKIRRSSSVGLLEQLGDFSNASLRVLHKEADTHPIPWKGKGDKRYSVFTPKGKLSPISRAVRHDYFIYDVDEFRRQWDVMLEHFHDGLGTGRLIGLQSQQVNSICYTAVMSWAAAVDLFNRSQGLGGTYFEILTGALVSGLSGRPVGGDIMLPLPGGKRETIKVDLTFEAADDRPCLVIPTKISTRERISQAYVHARILETARPGGYRTILCVANETNSFKEKGQDSRIGVYLKETLVPGTIALYQKYIAHLDGLYYLDPPQPYLVGEKPGLPPVRTFGDLLTIYLPGLLL